MHFTIWLMLASSIPPLLCTSCSCSQSSRSSKFGCSADELSAWRYIDVCQSGRSLPCISFRKLVLGLLHSFVPGQLLETLSLVEQRLQ